MTNFKPPTRPFIGARFHGGSQIPRAVVIHGTVSPDNAGTARTIAEWWHGPTSPTTSAHYVTDPREDIQCVGDHTIAYHCGYNTGSIAIELCDEEVGPATRWQDADSKAIIARAARLTAELCLAYGIEPVRPSVAELKAKGPHGIYGHNDSRLAFGYTTHSDPVDFPWLTFLRLVRKEIAALKDEANPPKVPTKIRISLSHHSMDTFVSDTATRGDVDKIFRRAKIQGHRWLTGTEAGPGNKALRDALKLAGEKYGYRIHLNGSSDAWIAVRKDIVKNGSFKGLYRKVLAAVKGKGAHTSRGVLSVTFEDVDLGTVTVIAAHYLTHGRPDAKDPDYRVRLEENRKLAKAIGDYAAKMGRGKGLVFYGGDQNIPDNASDTFLGEPLTSLGDELKKYPSTGHGPIDVIASYDGDGRVEGVSWNVLDDSEFKLATDHFTGEGEYDVRLLKAA